MAQEIPENATPVTTEMMLQCIGELFVQTRVLQTLLRQKLQGDNGAVDTETIKKMVRD